MKTDWRCLFPNWYACRWTPADGSPAVFKTVCGALLRRPGWVRFPSIPARFRGCDSQSDSHSPGCPITRQLRTPASTVDQPPTSLRVFSFRLCAVDCNANMPIDYEAALV